MKCNTILEEMQIPSQKGVIDGESLYQVLTGVTDQRAKRGRRYSAALGLSLIVLAKLAGEKTMSGIAQWARLRLAWLKEELPLKGEQLPCANTYQYICDHIDAEELNTKLGEFFASQSASVGRGPAQKAETVHLALDGKSLRGSRRMGLQAQAAVHLLGLYNISQQYVLRQVAVPGPGEERRSALSLLGHLNLYGCVVSADALHTYPAWCQQVLAQGGDYLLIAKGNQPELHTDIALLFSQPPRPWLPQQQAHRVDKAHGRLEVRHLRTSSELCDYLAPKWPGVAQVFQLHRQITRHNQTTTEITYGLTSLPLVDLPPDRLLDMIRAHWHIENRLHWRRDVTLGEDACRVSLGQTPQVLAALNNTILALMDHLGVSNMAAQIREFAAHPDQALALILQPL